MTIHTPQDRVLTWVLPWLPAAIAFVLLCVLLLLSERIVVGALPPVDAALAPVQQLRRSLLAWGGSITLLLAFAGFGFSSYLARHQREHRQRLREQSQLLSAAIKSASDAERALAQQQLALSELMRRLLQQEKQTTRKLAQTLHDQLGQTVGAMRLSFDALISLVPEPLTPKLKDRSRVLGQLIDTATAQVRQALVALRPPLLDEDGLQAALQHEVDARAADAEPVVLHLDVAPLVARTRWPADVEHAAFMVAREAMANALLHARARTVVLRVDGHADQLHLSVTDDGVGLNPDTAAGRPGHLGIVGMRERALAIGAHLNARSRIEGGTVVSLTWETSPHTPSPTRHPQDIDCATPPHHE